MILPAPSQGHLSMPADTFAHIGWVREHATNIQLLEAGVLPNVPRGTDSPTAEDDHPSVSHAEVEKLCFGGIRLGRVQLFHQRAGCWRPCHCPQASQGCKLIVSLVSPPSQGLVNNTGIDWFMPWPPQALHAVAKSFLGT